MLSSKCGVAGGVDKRVKQFVGTQKMHAAMCRNQNLDQNITHLQRRANVAAILYEHGLSYALQTSFALHFDPCPRKCRVMCHLILWSFFVTRDGAEETSRSYTNRVMI